MLDLGTSFIASVARDPDALALVGDGVRLTYAQWYGRISSVAAALDRLGLRPGDHLVSALQNREEAATLHWACQLAGIVITPVNWRVKADELDFYLENSEARALVYQDVSADAVAHSRRAPALPRIAATTTRSSASINAFTQSFMALMLAQDSSAGLEATSIRPRCRPLDQKFGPPIRTRTRGPRRRASTIASVKARQSAVLMAPLWKGKCR